MQIFKKGFLEGKSKMFLNCKVWKSMMCICEYVFMQDEKSYWGKPEGNSAQSFVFYLTLIEIKEFKNLLTSGGNSDCKESACNARDLVEIQSLGCRRSLGEGNDNQPSYSCLENPMNRGAWRAIAHSKELDTAERLMLLLSLSWQNRVGRHNL